MPMEHVNENDVIPHLRIVAHADRRIKNVQSERSLPIHPELIRLGFLDYIADARRAGQLMLFPEFRSPNSKSFASMFYKKVMKNWRDWAFADGSTGRRMVGGAVKDKDVHSFRGRAVSEMQARCPTA